VQGSVAEWASTADIHWASGVRSLLGPKLQSLSVTVGTDCEGIGAAIEGLRIMQHTGCIVSFRHMWSSEIHGATRSFFLTQHSPADIMCSDMTDRADMMGLDLRSNRRMQLPTDIDIYVCGFPCCPFSTRRPLLDDPFLDPKALWKHLR
jgi:site-specific DNA-cytosine methylase